MSLASLAPDKQRLQLRVLLHSGAETWVAEALDKITLDRRDQLTLLFKEYKQALAVSFEDYCQPILTHQLIKILDVESPLILYCQSTKWTGWWGPKFVIQQTILKIVKRGV